MKKYSNNFERDYEFYLKNKDIFIFYGNGFPKFKAKASPSGISAKEAFYWIESNGQNKPTREPDLLNELLACKASVNFNIKMWAEGLAERTLTLEELEGNKYLFEE